MATWLTCYAAARAKRLMICGAVCLAACSPTYNWREVQPGDTEVLAMFPCKPDRFSRSVTLLGAPVQMLLLSCSTAETTFALSHVELANETQAAAALQALQRAAADNIGGSSRIMAPWRVSGLSDNRAAQRLQFEGHRPDGGPLRAQAGFFTVATRVYQATVIGTRLDAEAVDTFFAGLRLPPV